jgi:DnaJ-like protein
MSQNAITNMQSPADALTNFPAFALTLRRFAKWGAILAALLTISLASSLLLFAALASPAAVCSAVVAGLLIRCVGQRLNLRQLRHSRIATNLATFEFDGKGINCDFNEAAVRRHTSAWKWRILSAIVAAVVCLAWQRFLSPGLNLLPERIRSFDLLNPLIAGCSFFLPLFAGAFFLWAKGPESYWARQAKATIELRAAASAFEILRHKELDGLAVGIQALWQALGLEKPGEYHAGFRKYLEAHAADAVTQPVVALSVLNAFTRLAHLDLIRLSAALALTRRLECQLKAVQAQATALREPMHEIRADELSAEVEELPQYAAARRWKELERRASGIERELEALRRKLSRPSVSAPTVVLAPGSDPYRLLGVTADTPTPVIKKLRLRLVQLYHPDVNDGAPNTAKMAELNAAYDAVMRDRKNEWRSA